LPTWEEQKNPLNTLVQMLAGSSKATRQIENENAL